MIARMVLNWGSGMFALLMVVSPKARRAVHAAASKAFSSSEVIAFTPVTRDHIAAVAQVVAWIGVALFACFIALLVFGPPLFTF